MAQAKKDVATRDRVLDTAEALFAEKGFHAVSVREITAGANCNLSAINYHFGNKHNLYLEVFRSRVLPRAGRVQKAFRRFLPAGGDISAGAVIQALARAFIEGPLSDEERRRHALLMAREMAKPTEAFELIAEQMIGVFLGEYAGMLREATDQTIEPRRLMLNVLSVFALVLYFNFARTAVTRITGQPYDQAFKSQLVEHITVFAMQGLEGALREENR